MLREESAKDMGVLNIGNALPRSLVPIVAPALLAIGGGGTYGALFLTTPSTNASRTCSPA
ncbi:hypothetical protein ACWCQW_23375 [Streptomyces mirabilis]